MTYLLEVASFSCRGRSHLRHDTTRKCHNRAAQFKVRHKYGAKRVFKLRLHRSIPPPHLFCLSRSLSLSLPPFFLRRSVQGCRTEGTFILCIAASNTVRPGQRGTRRTRYPGSVFWKKKIGLRNKLDCNFFWGGPPISKLFLDAAVFSRRKKKCDMIFSSERHVVRCKPLSA